MHFSVAVITKTGTQEEVDKLLAPYDEALEVAPYISEGNELSTYNPNAQWDWYETGGRWKNFLKRTDGTRHDSLRIKDCDFSPKEEDIKYFSDFWDQVVEGKVLSSPVFRHRKFLFVFSPDYYRNHYGTRENFIKVQSSFKTGAVLFSDGTWLEPEYAQANKHEWERDYEKNVLERLNPDEFITIVDCHI